MNKPLILVVEDDPSVRNLITTTLKTNDYRYVVAPNGSTAITEATSHNPEIILLDLGLPDMDGVQVIQTVRSWSNVPIIVISARSEDNDKIKGSLSGNTQQEDNDIQNDDAESNYNDKQSNDNSGDSSEQNTGGQVFTSTFGDFRLTAPDESWEFANEKELQELANAVDSYAVTDEEKQNIEAAKQRTVYDTLLRHRDSTANIIIMYENLSMSQDLANADAMQYAEVIASQLNDIGNYTVDSPLTVSFIGKPFVRMDATSIQQDGTLTQTYLIRKIDEYILAICLTPSNLNGITVDSMMSMFSQL